MSLYHLNLSSIGKSGGSSAVAAAAYRSCSALMQSKIDSETGIVFDIAHDFSYKQGLEFSQIFAPAGLDSFYYDREALWNYVEQVEKRTNARFARDIKIALQKEFTLEQNIELLSEFAKEQFVAEGIIADVNIHLDNEANPHAHIMLTTRLMCQQFSGQFAKQYFVLFHTLLVKSNY